MKNTPRIVKLLIADLESHPLNANGMPDHFLDKLEAHIKSSGKYPPLIVRPHPTDPGRYQLIDGHQRKRVLQRLDHQHAWCQVWEVDDNQTMILLSTLNRLEGQDDPYLRGNLLKELARQFEVTQLAEQLPLDADQIRKYIQATEDPPAPQPSEKAEDMPCAMTIFVTLGQRNRILTALKELHKDRGQAILTAITFAQAYRKLADETRTRSSPGPASAADVAPAVEEPADAPAD